MANIRLVPFTMDYLNDYYREFNEEITKYQYPDPFETEDDAKELLKSFLDEMEAGETLVYSILDDDNNFIGSTEIHGLKGDCPEVGVWIMVSEWRKGYAYTALKATLDHAVTEHGKKAFYYEADKRNTGSTKLLHKFEGDYEIIDRGVEKLTTESGKELELQGSVLKLR